MPPAEARPAADAPAPGGDAPRRIVIFTLDSLPSAVAMHRVLEGLDGRVVGIVASQRFGGRHGSLATQFIRNLRRSGVSFTAYLALHTLIYHPAAMIAGFVGRMARRPAGIRRLRALARDHGIPVIATSEPNAADTVTQLRELRPDLFLALHFDRVMRAPLLALPVHGTINVHPGALPELRGPFPVFWAMLRGHSRFGVTAHRIDGETLDTGPILAERIVPDDAPSSVLAMDCRLMAEAADLAVETIQEWPRWAAMSRAQDEARARYDTFPNAQAVASLSRRGRRLFTIADFVAEFRD